MFPSHLLSQILVLGLTSKDNCCDKFLMRFLEKYSMHLEVFIQVYIYLILFYLLHKWKHTLHTGPFFALKKNFF